MANFWFKQEHNNVTATMGLITNVDTMQQLFMRIDEFTDPYSVKIKEDIGTGMCWDVENVNTDPQHTNIQYDDETDLDNKTGWKIPPWARKNAKEMTYADDSVYNKCID